MKSTQVSCKTAPVEYYTVSILGCFSFTFLFTAKLPLLNTAGQLIFGFFYIHKNSESGFILRPLLSRTHPIQPVSALLAKMPGWYQRWEINGQTASSWQNNSNSSIQLYNREKKKKSSFQSTTRQPLKQKGYSSRNPHSCKNSSQRKMLPGLMSGSLQQKDTFLGFNSGFIQSFFNLCINPVVSVIVSFTHCLYLCVIKPQQYGSCLKANNVQIWNTFNTVFKKR